MKLSLSLVTILSLSALMSGCGQSTENTKTTPQLTQNQMDTERVAINTAPIASSKTLSVSTDHQGNFTLTAVDADNDPILFKKITNTQHGTITFKPNGTFSYLPDAGFSGQDMFTYSVSDGVSSCPNKTVTINVSAPTLPLPNKPTNLKVTSLNSCAVKLTWQDNSTNEDGFEIYKDGELYCVKNANETSTIVNGLVANKTYTFQVRAKNASGASSSIKYVIKTIAEKEIPNAPTNLKVTKKSDTIVRLAWEDNAANENGYEIYQNGTLLKTISTNCSCTMISGLSADTSYTFEVRAKNSLGNSSAASVTVVTDTKPETPPPVEPVKNKAPLVTTDANKVITLGDTVALIAKASDSDGSIIKYEWKENGVALSDKATFNYNPTTTGKHTLILTVTDDDNATASASVQVVVKEKVVIPTPDNTPPVITLNGASSITLSVGDKYTDAGATASDNKDGDITAKIASSGTVNTAVAGTYTITYNVKDTANNSATTITRTVIVKEVANKAPTANAGADKSVEVNKSLTLSGSGIDPEGKTLTYKWTEKAKTLGTTANLLYTPTTVGTHTLTLTVTDDKGASASDIVVVTATEAPDNIKPVITVGSDITITKGESLSDAKLLQGVTATDNKDGDVTVTIKSKGALNTNKEGTYTITYEAKDKAGNVAIASKKVIVSKRPNKAPTANAGTDKTTEINKEVALAGSGSDSDGSISKYEWKEDHTVLGNTPTLNYKPTTIGKHTLTLTVTDNDGASASDVVIVTATEAPDTIKPVITLQGKKTVTINIGDNYQDAGATAQDNKDGNITDKIVKSGTVDTSKAGVYTIKYNAKDSANNNAIEVTRTITVKEVANKAPTANAGADKSVEVNKSLTLAGSGIDPEGKTLTYKWTEKAKTLGTTANLLYTPTTVGTHTLTLTVTDDKGASASDVVLVTATEAPDNTPPVITLNGASSITLTVGDKYADAGATASDNKDGDITAKIVSSGTVNTAVAGTYTLTYNVKDTANNSATAVTRTVIVKEAVKEYGKQGKHTVNSTKLASGNAIAFYPTDYKAMKKMPIIFFTPGWEQGADKYQTLIDFIVSHGNVVLVAKDYYGNDKHFIDEFDEFLASGEDILNYVDKNKAGFIGHSSGAGNTFRMLEYFSKKGYGNDHRLLVPLDSWVAKGMSTVTMKALPQNTNALFFQFGEDSKESDPRFSVSEYKLLTSIDDRNKDYIVIPGANHYYASDKESKDGQDIKKTVAQMQGVLKPLDALLDYTFNDAQSDSTYNIALNSGNDTPIASGALKPRDINEYLYNCYYNVNEDINYCGNPTIATINQGTATAYSEAQFEDTFIKTAQADLPWSKDATKTVTVADIAEMFDKARASDDTVLAAYKKIKMPEQNVWDNYTDSQKAFYLINSERVARGIRMFEGIDTKVQDVSQAYAKFLIDHDAFSHTADGKDPKQRLKDGAGIDETINADFFAYSENLAEFDYGNTANYPSINEAVAMSVYDWLYADKKDTKATYGHRKFILATALKQNFGINAKEGLIGIGIETKEYKQNNFFHTKKVIVLNAFDPNNKWAMHGTREPKIILK